MSSEEQHNLFITPPTMYLPSRGLRITSIGVDDEWIEDIGDILESTLPSIPMTFYHLDSATRDQWQWLLHMVGHSNIIVVNIAKSTDIDMFIAIAHAKSPNIWFYVNEDEIDVDVVSFLNTLGANMFSTPDELVSVLRLSIE